MKYALSLMIALVACHIVGSLQLLERRCSSRKLQRNHFRVVGATDADLDTTPWMAYLHRDRRFICGGSLITYRFVLTAAHCIKHRERLVVRLGEYDTRTQIDCRERSCALPFVDFNIESFHPHPYYMHYTHYDIALLKLRSNVVGQNNIIPICLVLDTTDEWQRYVDSIEQFSVSGWGMTENGLSGGPISHVVQTANITQMDRNTCLKDFGYDTTDRHICAGDPRRHTCHGDSGGPLVATVSEDRVEYYVQFAAVSYGEDDCNGVGVFTNMIYYIQWIENIVKAHE